jgi:uncharacterized protein GlcG (DUF336 family)
MSNITLEEAERVLQAARKKATDMGVKLSISVVDARGDLVCMVRMDGAPWRTPYISRGKARASACFGIPSNDLTDRALTPVLRAVMEVEKGEFVPGQGALPIFKNGELIGAVGGSGGTAQEDEDASRAGVEAL